MSHNNSYGNYAGSYLNQCLPNIKGEYHDILTDISRVNISIDALFIGSGSRQGSWQGQNYSENELRALKFSAARSSSVYRDNCLHIRPYSYLVYMWVRTN